MTSKQKSNQYEQKKNNKKNEQNTERISLKEELYLLAFIGASIVLFLGNFGLAGVGDSGINWICKQLFGVFGIIQYFLPVWLVISVCFHFANRTNKKIHIKLAIILFIFVIMSTMIELIKGTSNMGLSISTYYEIGKTQIFTGGVLGSLFANGMYHVLGSIASVVSLLLLLIACLVLLTERSFVREVETKGKKMYRTAKDDLDARKQLAKQRRIQQQEARNQEGSTDVTDDSSRRTKRKVANGMSAVSFQLPKKQKNSDSTKDEMHELFVNDGMKDMIAEDENFIPDTDIQEINESESFNQDVITIQRGNSIKEVSMKKNSINENSMNEETFKADKADKAEKSHIEEETFINKKNTMPMQKTKNFQSPSLDLLNKSKKAVLESDEYLSTIGLKLQQTLQSFGVKVVVTNVSCGPSVTRYELQPEQGVKVSRIVSLADDIKLNLAVADIRIEAPIPGKAAVGIEVPNRESSAVMLRDLLESPEFQKSVSPLAFAVGKDISGKVIVADIARMPHLLIAGATGSGKSVCINTLIMSILYKADPNQVKIIMIDPKVVELSVYNGIPHMFIPVVTDPKKAAGALNWAVSEMSERYQKFAELNVRDLKGYNAKVDQMPKDLEDSPKPLPQIVIIVDELADLMMVSKNEVEDAICRLAQLARAAGIHLIIATQRPSVDVITGLIKANMPSRIAFSVSSGVDSRTIIDINGAEKLLGKGDMLFYPSGYPKPVRVQGAFVSDKEVSEVVSFLVEQNQEVAYNHQIEERIQQVQKVQIQVSENNSIYDDYFVEAGKFIIEKDKGSIGMLQRVFKIGFNRAARIMDQLEEAGVVGEEEGTKPRKVLMSIEEFELFIEESV